MTRDTDPIAHVTKIEHGQGVRTLVVGSCPRCGKTHRHGGGALTDDPNDFMGHRVGHCSDNKGGYHLTPALDLKDHDGTPIMMPIKEVLTEVARNVADGHTTEADALAYLQRHVGPEIYSEALRPYLERARS